MEIRPVAAFCLNVAALLTFSCTILLPALLHVSSAAEPSTEFELDSDLGAIQSPYTDRIKTMLKSWPPRIAKEWSQTKDPVTVVCIRAPENDTYVGVIQVLRINAPLSQVAKVLENFSEYPQLFENLLVTEQKNVMQNRWTVAAEQRIPVPFIANEKNEMAYVVDTSQPNRRIYRFQLLKSNHLKSSDGFVVLEALSPTETLYTEGDFWDAEYGIAKKLGTNRIWKQSIQGLLQADVATKFKAEHPERSNSEIKKASGEFVRKLKFDREIREFKTWDAVFPSK